MGYDFTTPLRRDGSCIGGHGETIIVADFDGDSRVDILLPSYERFDFLHNLGDGRFEEIADDLGISFPDYVPHVEGAVAVDVNLDGAVDLVIASEVLINDGAGRFTALAAPFGPMPFFDEGMSVHDVDGDGRYDIVKNHPNFGPRVFWGSEDRLRFEDSDWLLGGGAVLQESYGLAVGSLTGRRHADILVAGGAPWGQPPTLCVQPQARRFDCLKDVFPTHREDWQDLLLLTDLDDDGSLDLVARYGSIRSYAGAAPRANVFRIDLRDGNGRRNQYGHSLRAICALGGSSLGLRFVDGGRGYMTQGDYVVPFTSSWCSSIEVEVFTTHGPQRSGPFAPGTTVLNVVRE